MSVFCFNPLAFGIGFHGAHVQFRTVHCRFENELVSEIQSAYGEQGVTLPKSGRVSAFLQCRKELKRLTIIEPVIVRLCMFQQDSKDIWLAQSFTPFLLDAKVGISSKHIEAWTFFEETALCLNSIHVMMGRKKSFWLPVFCVGTIHDRWWCAGWRKHGRKGNRWKSFVPNLTALKITTKNKLLSEVTSPWSKEKCQILKGTSGLPPGTTLQYAQLEALCALQPSGEVRVKCKHRTDRTWTKLKVLVLTCTYVILRWCRSLTIETWWSNACDFPGAGPTIGDGLDGSGQRQQPRVDGDGFPGSWQRPHQRCFAWHRRMGDIWWYW